MIHYWTDKFCLLRNWAQIPDIGPKITLFSAYFFTASVVLFAVCSSYSFARFPYDNACQNKDSAVDKAYVGNYVAYDMDGREVEISVQENDPTYVYCLQDMYRYSPIAFPPIASKQPYGQQWMTTDQERITKLLGFTTVSIVIFVSLLLVYHFLIAPIISRCSRNYEPRGEAMKQKFTEVKEICAYVPQSRLHGYPFPVILCDLRHIHINYIGWKCPDHPHEYYNVANDIPSLTSSAFAIVKQWIPLTTNTPLSSYGSLSSSLPSQRATSSTKKSELLDQIT